MMLVIDLGLRWKKKRHSVTSGHCFGAVISDHYGLSGYEWPLLYNAKDAGIGTRELGLPRSSHTYF